MLDKAFFCVAIIWVAVSAAIIVGLYVTKNPFCLCGFVFPLFVKYKRVDTNEKKESEIE